MSLIKYYLQFGIYIILQVFVFEYLGFGLVSSPHVSILFIAFSPLRLNTSLYFVSAFTFGIIIDSIKHPLGAHAMACVLIAGIRFFWLEIIKPQVSSDELEVLNLEEQSLLWQLAYVTPLIFIYELYYFILVDIGISVNTLLKILAGGSYTVFVAAIFIILFYRKNPK